MKTFTTEDAEEHRGEQDHRSFKNVENRSEFGEFEVTKKRQRI